MGLVGVCIGFAGGLLGCQTRRREEWDADRGGAVSKAV